MRVIIDGHAIDNPHTLRIEVAPGGETVGPWRIEFVGGQLVVQGADSGEPGLSILFNAECPYPGLTFMPGIGSSPPLPVLAGA